MNMTYTVRNLSMAQASNNLFTCKEASKSRRIRIGIWKKNRETVLPFDASGTREKVLQQSILTTHFDIHMAISETWRAAGFLDAVDTIYCGFGIIWGIKFHITVHSFSSRPFHNYMNRATLLWSDEPSLSPKELYNFLLCDGVGNLLSNLLVFVSSKVLSLKVLILTLEILATPKVGRA